MLFADENANVSNIQPVAAQQQQRKLKKRRKSAAPAPCRQQPAADSDHDERVGSAASSPEVGHGLAEPPSFAERTPAMQQVHKLQLKLELKHAETERLRFLLDNEKEDNELLSSLNAELRSSLERRRRWQRSSSRPSTPFRAHSSRVLPPVHSAVGAPARLAPQSAAACRTGCATCCRDREDRAKAWVE